MARVTDPEVREIIPSTSITDLTPFITAADLMVDKVEASDCGSDLTAAELKEVSRWLSAHLAAVSDPKLAKESEKVEGYQIKFSRGSSSEKGGIKSTQYGKTANSISGGCLAELDKRTPGFFATGGAHYSE